VFCIIVARDTLPSDFRLNRVPQQGRVMVAANKAYVIVVGIDYSEVSRAAIREAFGAALAHQQSEVHVLHVEAEIQAYPHADPQQSATTDEALTRSLQRVERFVADELALFQRSQRLTGTTPFARVTSHVRTHSPGREIAQLAVDLDADLVVVGTHGRSGLARLLLGSVAHAVVNLAPCPVLVVREKQLTPELPRLEPACPLCIEVRQRSAGRELWCEQHRERHGQRHTYHQRDRVGEETNFPLIFDRN
jgi:nucleotide-binding universal stress UspA family protein